jgi:hypothetical protein
VTVKRAVLLFVMTLFILSLAETCLPGSAGATDVHTSMGAIKQLWAGDRGCGDTSVPVPPPPPPPPPDGTLLDWVWWMLSLL